jgi:hypothetical protein
VPKSRYVSASRLRPLVIYFAVAFAVLLAADALVGMLGTGRGGRQVVVLGWIVLFPLGGWLVWRRGEGRS